QQADVRRALVERCPEVPPHLFCALGAFAPPSVLPSGLHRPLRAFLHSDGDEPVLDGLYGSLDDTLIVRFRHSLSSLITNAPVPPPGRSSLSPRHFRFG